jgi:Heavy metal binding domain
MTLRRTIAVSYALALAGCSPGPAPVATSPRDPSNPNAAEGVSPLPPPSQPSEAPAGDPSHLHGHRHGTPGAAGAEGGAPSPGQAAAYACPMHPEVTSPTPGQCPKCGMNLVPKK